jgi:FkbM family methyltransferase
MGLIKSILPEEWYGKFFRLRNSLLNKNEEEQESAEVLQARKLFYSQFLKNGELCFDVGANVGNRIEPMLQIGAKVVAVEPQKKCYETLQKKFGDSITIVTKGLSDKEEIKEFYISDSTTISSFSKEWIDKVKETRFKYYAWNKVEKVEMTTLDNLIQQYGLPAFIKIDVEGYELEVLSGLTKKVKFISFEYTVPEQTDKAIACLEKLITINPELTGNFSVGESMKLEKKVWMKAPEMLTFINSKEFTDTGFGDIYIQNQ